MFSGLLGAVAPMFAGRAWDALKPALTSTLNWLTNDGAERLGEAAQSLGLNKIAKTVKKVGKAAKILTGKRTSGEEFKDEMMEGSESKIMPEDDDAEEFRKYLELKKKKPKLFNMSLEGPGPDYLREG